MTTATTTTELQLLREISTASVPANFFQSSGLKTLLTDIAATGREVEEQSKTLERLRKEKADGNFLGNWLKNRGIKVDDANLTLTMTVGKLTQQSSTLLVLNTAVSKVLHQQQAQLQAQQVALNEQAVSLREQNEAILHQHEQLARHQCEINEANRGLLEAKGVTQEQAQQLVGCVTRVMTAEQTLDAKLAEALATVTQQLGELQAWSDARHQQAATGAARFAEEQRLALSAHATAVEQRFADAAAGLERHHTALTERMDASRVETAGRLGALATRLDESSGHVETVSATTGARLDALQATADDLRADMVTEVGRRTAGAQALESRLADLERRFSRGRGWLLAIGLSLAASVAWQAFMAVAA